MILQFDIHSPEAILAEAKRRFLYVSNADALDHIYDTFDTLLLGYSARLNKSLSKEWEVAGKTLSLAATQINELPLSAYLSMLAVTYPYRRVFIIERAELLDAFDKRVRVELSESDAEEMLRGLR